MSNKYLMESVCKKLRTDFGVKLVYPAHITTMSDNDSDVSNMSSPKSYFELQSPQSSPSQMVPTLMKNISQLNCNDGNNDVSEHRPYLRITEEPQDYFRFRYKSEMVGTHGCLLGKSYTYQKIKTHPTVELVNYHGRAIIKCRLAQYNCNEDHPHKLLDEEQDREVSKEVPEDGIYKLAFPGLGIIHTAKKNVAKQLFAKYMATGHHNERELRARCENEAKLIDLNIVRLMFSAHDVNTGIEICPPVFSEKIHNLKSAATNDLKICRISRCQGRPCGGDDVYLLVEKVNKKNIEIRFVEYADNGSICWTGKASFLQTDVHHQYAIVCRTPAYHNTKIASDVHVKIILVRPSDGKFSEPKEFTYKAEPMYRQNKKRKANSSYNSLSSSDSINSVTSDFPAALNNFTPGIKHEFNGHVETAIPIAQTQLPTNFTPEIKHEFNGHVETAIPIAQTQLPTAFPNAIAGNQLDDALYLKTVKSNNMQTDLNPLLSQPNIPAPPFPTNTSFSGLDSAEIVKYLPNDLSMEEKMLLSESDLKAYFEEGHGVSDITALGLQLIPDSGVRKSSTSSTDKKDAEEAKKSKHSDYDGMYNKKDGIEAKQLVADICASIKMKDVKKQDIRNKVERLFELRLMNGDAFLHMTMYNNLNSLKGIVTIMSSLKMFHLLNMKNPKQETILHIAIMKDLPDVVNFLISKGVDPNVTDSNENNLVHFAVMCESCLDPLLDAISKYHIKIDLDAYNKEKQTALHLASVHNSARSVRLLVAAGASYDARDQEGRTPLHLAAYDDYVEVVAALLDFTPKSDIDAVDGTGNTALQIVCGSNTKKKTNEIVKLLLDHGANPVAAENSTKSAWKSVQNNPFLRQVMKAYVSSESSLGSDDIKSEPEDDYESADDGEGDEEAEDASGLPLLSQYESGVSRALDASGGWRQLAARTHHDALLSWFENTPSPTTTLLDHLKRSDTKLTSKGLATILEDMGEAEAAFEIRKYVE